MLNKKQVQIPIADFSLEGDLAVPDKAQTIVIFAHGSGSSRLSPRNQFVAKFLQDQGFATLLFDLLTVKEDEDYANRFDIPLLAERLKIATQWLQKQKEFSKFTIGYFGASTGAAAALIAAADLNEQIKAVVSRGGRPDLAMDILEQVKAPTLLIVGGDDDQVIELNQQAYDQLQSVKEISIIPGATHLFEEPGALNKVAEQAAIWFKKYLK